MDDLEYLVRGEAEAGFRRSLALCEGDDALAVAGRGGSYAANREALDSYSLNLRVLHGVGEPDTSVTVMGLALSMPVFGSPLSGAFSRLGDGPSEAGFVSGLLAGCDARGVVGCVGDGLADRVFLAGVDALRKPGVRGICFVKPWSGSALRHRIEQAEAAGAVAVGVEADEVVHMDYARRGRPLAPMSPGRLSRIIRSTELPFVVKGVMTPDEALLAAELGAAAVVVSNRGGRMLNDCPGVADVLPWISEAVQGAVSILVEGGAYCGVDVLKMLALGADAVMIGGPLELAALGGGQRGVEEYLGRVQRELEQAMLMTGTARAAQVNRTVLYERRR
ncbi:alpha-hydroxy-acid oxidizing protein [Desulfocurvus sp. DL9XJH121]